MVTALGPCVKRPPLISKASALDATSYGASVALSKARLLQTFLFFFFLFFFLVGVHMEPFHFHLIGIYFSSAQNFPFDAPTVSSKTQCMLAKARALSEYMMLPKKAA